MNGKRSLLLFAIVALVLASVLSAWLWLPRAVDLLPGRIRVRLPDQFLALVTTPLPTALPAPLRPADPQILDNQIGATATIEPTWTPRPTMTQAAAASEPGAGPAVGGRTPLATATPDPTPTATPIRIPLPGQVRLDSIKNTPQKYNNCGPANLSIVLGYYGYDIHQLDIGEALKPNYEDRNVSPYELVNYVGEETDLQAMTLAGLELENLRALLAAEFPVIVEKGLDLSDSHGWMGHYLTLFGYDEDEQVFYGLDTFLGPFDSVGRDFEYEELDFYWAQFNRLAVIIYPVEREEELALALGSEALDESLMWQAATQQAQEMLATSPEDAFAWFDLGASLYHLGTLEGDDALLIQSAAAFDQAREIGLPWRTLWYQFEPYLAYIAAGRFDEVLALTDAVLSTSGGRNIEESYLFRGHALLATGDQIGAERAYERALRLNPGIDAAREALQALAASEAGRNG